MRSINLQSLCQAYKHLSNEQFHQYINVFGFELSKQQEIEDLCFFIEVLHYNLESLPKLDGFYVGYKIPQISKEFDLLRLGHNFFLNIEVKHTSTFDKIEKQLKENSYYLKAVSSEVHVFTFVVDTQKIYTLDNNGNLVETNLQELIYYIQEQDVKKEVDLDTLFAPKQYLVSPLNSTEKFINGNYFLTNAQREVKKDVISLLNTGEIKFALIKGKPGTGKTLLTYDIAHEYMNHGQNVIIVHNGILSDGHWRLRNEYGWIVYSIKEFYDNYINIMQNKIDLIVFDEAQRTYISQLEKILGFLYTQPTKCILSFDPEQFFSASENKGVLVDLLQSNGFPYKEFQLSDKIRTNKELSAFVLNLFDRSKINTNPNLRFNNIYIQYFTEAEDVRMYLINLQREGWQVLTYTSSTYNPLPYDTYESGFRFNAHKVIGQEFDKVAVVINEYFFYNDDGKLLAYKPYGAPSYRLDKMLYQNLTRAREALNIVIYRNPALLEACSKIINRYYGSSKINPVVEK